MEIIGWTGKAVPDNRRLLLGKQRRFVLNPGYKAFKEGLAWEIRAQCRERYKSINLMVSFELASRVDKQNLLKPICDAVELAGLVKNDREIWTIMLMPTVKSRDKADHIYLFINGDAER